VLLRLAYLAVANAFAVLCLLPASDRDKDTEILVLRHQLAVLESAGRAEGAVRPDRPGVAGRAAAPPDACRAAPDAVADASGHSVALAP
jgi:hypothetical protein